MLHSKEPVVARSLWQSYKGVCPHVRESARLKRVSQALPARTRLYVSMAVCSVGAVGMFVSDYLEDKYPASPPSITPTYDSRPAS